MNRLRWNFAQPSEPTFPSAVPNFTWIGATNRFCGVKMLIVGLWVKIPAQDAVKRQTAGIIFTFKIINPIVMKCCMTRWSAMQLYFRSIKLFWCEWQFLAYFSLLVNCDTLRFAVMSFSLSTELDVFSLLDITLWFRCAGGWQSMDKEVKVLALWSSKLSVWSFAVVICVLCCFARCRTVCWANWSVMMSQRDVLCIVLLTLSIVFTGEMSWRRVKCELWKCEW